MLTLSLESNGINFGLVLNGKMIYVEKIKGKRDRKLNHNLLKYMIKRRLKELGLFKESVVKICPFCYTNVKLEELKEANDITDNIRILTYIRPRDAKIFVGLCKVCNE